MKKCKQGRRPFGKNLLQELKRRGIKPVKTVTLHFDNDDVSEFLKKLKKFEEESMRAKIVVR